MESLIQPVLTGMNWLTPDLQALALSTAVTALCEAWTTHILLQKIRFRLDFLPHQRVYGRVITAGWAGGWEETAMKRTTYPRARITKFGRYIFDLLIDDFA